MKSELQFLKLKHGYDEKILHLLMFNNDASIFETKTLDIWKFNRVKLKIKG